MNGLIKRDKEIHFEYVKGYFGVEKLEENVVQLHNLAPENYDHWITADEATPLEIHEEIENCLGELSDWINENQVVVIRNYHKSPIHIKHDPDDFFAVIFSFIKQVARNTDENRVLILNTQINGFGEVELDIKGEGHWLPNGQSRLETCEFSALQDIVARNDGEMAVSRIDEEGANLTLTYSQVDSMELGETHTTTLDGEVEASKNVLYLKN